MAGETEGEEQAEKSVERRGERHGDAIGSGETVSGNGRTEGTCDEDADVREKKKRRPENRGAYGEMVVEVAGDGAKVGTGLIIYVEARAAETFIGELVVPGEIKTVLDERGTGKSIVTNAIATDPRIQKRKRENPEKKKQPLGRARAARGRSAEVWLFRQRGTCRKLSYPRHPLLQGSIKMWKRTPQTEEGTW